MTHQKITIGQAMQWFAAGWHMFTRSAGLWIAMVVVVGVAVLVLSMIPQVGPILAPLLMPVIMGGLLYGAARLDGGHGLEFAHAFQGFIDTRRLINLLILGLVPLAGALLGAIITPAVVGDLSAGQPGPEAIAAAGGGMMRAVLIGMLINLAVFFLMVWAVPMVMLAGAEPRTALLASLRASLDNLGPVIVFLLVYVVLALLASLPVMLGWLVLGPVMVGAVYRGYRDLFGQAGGGTAEPGPAQTG